MEITVTADGILSWSEIKVPCALGRSGVRIDKREGDGATPVGRFTLRRLLFRADRLPAPRTALPVAMITPQDGWCDDPTHPLYNQPVSLPFPASHERLWRDDDLYDVVVVLGHNDTPPRPGEGSAIFLHIAKPGFLPTEGCVALALADLLSLVAVCTPLSALTVTCPTFRGDAD